MVGVSVAVAVGLGVAEGVSVGLAVSVGVSVAEGVKVAVALGTSVGVSDGVALSVGLGDTVGDGLSVALGIGVSVAVADAVKVGLTVTVGVSVISVAVALAVVVAVDVSVTDGLAVMVGEGVSVTVCDGLGVGEGSSTTSVSSAVGSSMMVGVAGESVNSSHATNSMLKINHHRQNFRIAYPRLFYYSNDLLTYADNTVGKPMYSTFLIYSEADNNLATRIYTDLLKKGVRPWASDYDLAPGDPVEATQRAALAACTHVVVFVSNAYLADDAQKQLTEKALADAKTIIAVAADRGVKVPDNLGEPIKLSRRYGAAVEALAEKLPTDADPLDDVPAWQRGNEAYFSGDYEDALEAYQQISEDDETAITLNSRAAAYNALRKHEEALEDIAKALELDADKAQYYRNRSLALAGLDRHEEALADDEKAIALQPDLPENHSSYAMTLVALERYDDAVAAIQKAIDLQPDNPLYPYQLGYIHSQADQPEAAIEAFDAALELHPDYPSAIAGRRMMLGKLGRFEEALAEVDKEIRKNPRKGGGYITRSLINFYMGRDEEAVKDATAALTRSGEHQIAGFFNRAIALWRLGETEKAQKDYLQAVQLMNTLATPEGIHDNAESELTAEIALEILASLEDQLQ